MTFCKKMHEFAKKMQKNLVNSKKSSTFALAFEKRADLRAFSSAGLEHLPYKQRVCGSNP